MYIVVVQSYGDSKFYAQAGQNITLICISCIYWIYEEKRPGQKLCTEQRTVDLLIRFKKNLKIINLLTNTDR